MWSALALPTEEKEVPQQSDSVRYAGPMRRCSLPVLLALLSAGCASSPRLVPQGGFEHALGREQALSGRVWSRARSHLVCPEELLTAVRASSYLLLGETHDNADHHRLQAQLLDVWLGAHPRGARVAFEMIDEAQSHALDEPYPVNADALAAKLDWSQSGWPDFSLYRPIFEVALDHGARIVAAHPNREHLRASMHGASPEETESLKLEPPLPEAERAALAQEIRDSHCGQAPEAMVAPMIAAQTFKDAWMARALADATPPAALIAGSGHVRDDRGVPAYLARRGGKSVLTVDLIGVQAALEKPEEYELAPYDFVIFTPRVDDASACDRFREQLAKMRKGSK